MGRYNLKYKYSLDYGESWIDITEIVDSAQTSIVHNLCTAGFKSAKDTASFTIPANNTALKQNLINALLDGSVILVQIYESDTIIYTGYVNKDSISIRSYPLTASISIELEDVSVLNLDSAVNAYISLKNYTITDIVHYLLDKANYSYDNSSILTADEQTLEAFVIDKDDSDTYRDYIDTLLFEVGGYVLNFTATGEAQIVKIDYNATGTASLVDNPMISEGITTKTNILKEDGVSLKWATTKWSKDNNQLLWQDSISRSLSDDKKYVVGEDVETGHYWPKDGELSPAFQEYNASLLDSDYLTNATRKQNEDLTILLAENVRAEIQATKDNQAFNDWQYPLIAEFIDDYELITNPIAYPKKAWYLLYNNSGATVNIQHFRLYGRVFYRDKLNTLKTKGTKNPKEYESKYIYNEAHANQFLQFYWHFMQTSRYSVSWKEVDSNRTLGDIVQVYHKGSLSYIKAVIAGVTTTYIGKTKITSYSAVGVAAKVVPYPTLASTRLKGATLSENKGIHEIKVMYATSVTQTGPKTAWQDDIPTLSYQSARYLWQKETVYYTDGTSEEFEELISVYGAPGTDGTSITIKDKSVKYGNSDSGTTEPTTWDIEPAPVKGKYLWSRTLVQYSDDTETTSFSVAYVGEDGKDGTDGTSPKLTSQTEAFQNSTSGTAIPSGTWTPTASPVEGQYTWTRTTLNYSDGTQAFAYSVSYTAKNGKDGSSVEVQYSYSPSPDFCYDEAIQWSGSDVYWGTEQALWDTWVAKAPEEKEGQYIWLRARVGNGSWNYTRLTGVQAKIYKLKSSNSVLTRNDRKDGTGVATFECDIQGYADYSPSLTINGKEVELSVSDGVFYYVYQYNYKNAQSIEVRLFNGKELMDALALDVVDETPPVAYLGVQEELPTKNGELLLLEGDSCVYSGAVYIYQSVGGWKKTTESVLSQTARAQALTWAMNDVLKNIQDGSITATEYAYFENVVANIITASYIGSKTIELQEGGVIQSEGYTERASVGFKLQANGKFDAQGASFSGVELKTGSVFNSDCMLTSNKSETASLAYTIAQPADPSLWWVEGNEIYNFFFSYYNKGAISCSITFKQKGSSSASTKDTFKVSSKYNMLYLDIYDASEPDYGYGIILGNLPNQGSISTEQSWQVIINGTTVLQCGAEYSNWIYANKYCKLTGFAPSSEAFVGTVKSGTYSYLDTAMVYDIAGYAMNVTPTSVSFEKDGTTYSIVNDTYYTEGRWPQFTVEYDTKPKGVYVSDLMPMVNATDALNNIGTSSNPFNQIFAHQLIGVKDGETESTVTADRFIGNVNTEGTEYKVYGAVFN